MHCCPELKSQGVTFFLDASRLGRIISPYRIRGFSCEPIIAAVVFIDGRDDTTPKSW
jgi:hypothetical protein